MLCVLLRRKVLEEQMGKVVEDVGLLVALNQIDWAQ